MNQLFFYLAACQSQDRTTTTTTVPPIQSVAPPAGFHSNSVASVQPSPSSAQTSTRASVAMGCAAASLTPPNVSAASLEGDVLSRTVPVLCAASSAATAVSNNAAPPCRGDKDGKVRVLTGKTQTNS